MMARHGERGATIVETAIAMTAALMVLVGIMYFGMLLYDNHTVAEMARQGARWAMVRGSSCTQSGEVGETNCPATAAEIQTYVQSLAIGMNPANLTVTPSWSSATGCTASATTGGPGCQVTVAVSYPFKLSLPYTPKFGITLSSSSTMTIAQ